MRTSRPRRDFARTLRQSMTPPEVWLWVRLRGMKANGFRFRRQVPIGPYVLDFYCVEIRLAVEVDGRMHNVQHDLRRDAWLEMQGIDVMRLPAMDVLRDPDEAADQVARRAAAMGRGAGIY